MRGSAEVAADGAIQSARITQARLSPGDSIQAEVVNTATGVKATVRGTTLDARPIIKAVADEGAPSQAGGKDFDLDMKIASVSGANRQSISGLELNLSRRGGDDRLAYLKGRLGQGTLAAGRGPDGLLRLTSSDAGALAKFADLYTRMEGGNLDLVLRTGGGTSSGEATVTDFALRDEPAFRRLIAAAPSPDSGRPVDPQLARFEKATIAFAHTPGALDIKDAVIYNPYMGLTTEGTVDFARNAIDVSGTFVPAYAVNTLLGKIPLVGVLLGRRQERGPVRHHLPGSGPVERPQG